MGSLASEQAGPADLTHQLRKAKEGKAWLSWQQKSQISKSFSGNFTLGVQRSGTLLPSAQILCLRLPMSGNNLHCLEISSFTHGLKMRSVVLKMLFVPHFPMSAES